MSDLSTDPRAAPPITIGPFTNVPAPGSPIRSDWPQQISQYVAVDNKVHVKGGVGRYSPAPTVSGAVVLNPAITAVPYATTMLVTVNAWVSINSGTVDNGTTILTPVVAGQTVNTPGLPPTPANRWGPMPITQWWAVPANANPGFSVSVTFAGSGGTTYVYAECTWNMYRN